MSILESSRFQAYPIVRGLSAFSLSVIVSRIASVSRKSKIALAIKRALTLDVLVASFRDITSFHKNDSSNELLFTEFMQILQLTEHQLVGFISNWTLSGNSLIIDKSKYAEEIRGKDEQIAFLKIQMQEKEHANSRLSSVDPGVKISEESSQSSMFCEKETQTDFEVVDLVKPTVQSTLEIPDEEVQSLLNLIVRQQTYLKLYKSALETNSENLAPKIDSDTVKKELDNWLVKNNCPLGENFSVKMKEERTFEFVKDLTSDESDEHGSNIDKSEDDKSHFNLAETIQSESLTPALIKSDVIQPKTAPPENVKPENVKPETVQPKTVKPQQINVPIKFDQLPIATPDIDQPENNSEDEPPVPVHRIIETKAGIMNSSLDVADLAAKIILEDQKKQNDTVLSSENEIDPPTVFETTPTETTVRKTDAQIVEEALKRLSQSSDTPQLEESPEITGAQLSETQNSENQQRITQIPGTQQINSDKSENQELSQPSEIKSSNSSPNKNSKKKRKKGRR